MNSRDELIEVALAEFMVNGYKKTSLSMITGKLGITKPALYYYFLNKEALFKACIELFFSRMNQSAQSYTAIGESSKEKLFHLLMYFSFPNNKELPKKFNHFYFIFDAVKNVPEVQELYMNSSNALLESLQLIIEEGILNKELRKDIDIEALLFEMGVLIEGLAISYYMGYLEDNENMVERVFELVWKGLI
ncbi:MAG: TetR/AcrR family transcriptional regulator [Clostridiales bacterium]|nr:TetR/AcrR family transcriptional regulator [Clostridiales bacterium]